MQKINIFLELFQKRCVLSGMKKALVLSVLLLANILTASAAMDITVVSVGGAPKYRVPSERQWWKITPGQMIPDSFFVDVSNADTVLVRLPDGRERSLKSTYGTTLGRALGRTFSIRPGAALYRMTTPVAVTGVRGADRAASSGLGEEDEAVYRRPRELWNAIIDAVRRGDAEKFSTFFTDETLSDSFFAEYIGSIQIVLPYPDTIDFQMQRLQRHPASFLEKEEIIGDFAEWFRAVNVDPEGENHRYEIIPSAVEPLRRRMTRYRQALSEFHHSRADYVTLQIRKYESKHVRIPTSMADLLAEDSSLADLKNPVGGIFSLSYDEDSRRYIIASPWIGGTEESHTWKAWELLKRRTEMEQRMLSRAIRDFQEINGRLPTELDELLSLPAWQRQESPIDVEKWYRTDYLFDLKFFPSLRDPWQHPWQYETNGETYAIVSLSPDGDTFRVSGPPNYFRARRSGILGFTTLDTGGRFSVRVDDNSQPVFLAGTFNNWSATATPMSYDPANDIWTTTIEFTPGSYGYKFVHKGRWFIDPANKCTYKDGQGGLNSWALWP